MKITFRDKKRICAEINGFEIQTDQSKNSGGLEEYPNPFELFKASIGCCMSYYVMAFCLEREIPLNSIWVEFDFVEKINLETVNTTIHVGSNFPMQYLNAIEKSTKSCKIKRSYESPPEFLVNVNLDQ